MKSAPASVHNPQNIAREAAQPPAAFLERLAAGLLTAVIVCRLLTPTDAAMTGETLWIAQFALLAFLVWVVAAWRVPALRMRFDWLDASVALLCLGHVLSALTVICTRGDKRAAMTMLWEWIGLLATFLLMRRLLVRKTTRQNLLLALASASAVLGGLGIWQHHFGFSESRQKYAAIKSRLEALEQTEPPADPAAALDRERSLHEVRGEFAEFNIPADASARQLWEQRLNSAEPIALFALANTLAGILVVAAILWIGQLVANGAQEGRAIAMFGAVANLFILYCLLLTKSRTGWVGLTIGLAALGWQLGLHRAKSAARLKLGLAGGAAALVVLIGVAYTTGGLDRFVVSESLKSLRYRFEYWTSTWHMLASSSRKFWLGVGGGNFRQNYLEFKLPQSSEEIADPHNLVLDVWSNGGLLALLGLAGVCWFSLRPLWRATSWIAGPEILEGGAHPPQRSTSRSGGIGLSLFADGVLLGGAMGFLVVLGLGLADDLTLLLLLTFWVLIVCPGRRIFQRDIPPVVVAAAAAGLIVHLSGAGGIGMPAVSQVLLLLAAAAVPARNVGGAETQVTPPVAVTLNGRTLDFDNRPDSRVPTLAAGVLGLILYLGCWVTGLLPVITVRTLLDSAQIALFQRAQPAQAERDYRQAAEADPWAVVPPEKLAELSLQVWLTTPGNPLEYFERSVKWQQQAIDRDPRNAGGYRFLGEIFLSKANRDDDPVAAAAAAAAFQQASALYPHHAGLQSLLAEALWKAKNAPEARQAARRAVDLDEGNQQLGHTDKRLPVARRNLMDEILAGDSN